MRTLLPLIIAGILFFSIPAKSQLVGSGTFDNPYSGGTVTGEVIWDTPKIYISGDITIGTDESQGHLIIEPGVTVVFTAASTDMIVTGLGRITAEGNEADTIRFTADHNDNGIYGESGETWGHIVFTSMTGGAGQSLFSYCIIEFGDVRQNSSSTSFGGGLYINRFSNLIIENTVIRNNRATHGGGIMLRNGSSPLIRNSVIKDNQANTSGGGIYSMARNNLVIENSVVIGNHSGGGSGGGVYIDGNDNSRIVNCIITNNTTSAQRGANILIYSSSLSTRARFINSVIWGADNSIGYFFSTIPLATDFVNCAIQDVNNPVDFYTDCIPINASNSHEEGPNFGDPSSGDWSIPFTSPLRDAGIDEYEGTVVPGFDYRGNPRIHMPDIGVYEYQYSRWRSDAGTTDWNTPANWYGGLVPVADRDVIIPGHAPNYPVATPGPNHTVAPGRHFILKPGARLTLGSLTNNGTVLMLTDETEQSSLITDSHSGNDIEIELYLQSGSITTPFGQFNRWHYISSPFTSLNVDAFTDVTLNLTQWVESFADPSLLMGWVAFDGFNYGTGTITGPTFSSLTPGVGYNYFHTGPASYRISGMVNTSDAIRELPFSNPMMPQQYGLNLTGNPFPSGLDWDMVTSDPSYPENTSKVLHYTKDDEHVYYVNGIGSIPGMNGIVPPMQGFFIKTYNEYNASVTLPASARVHDNIPPRYKGESKSHMPHLRLKLFTEGQYSDNAVVRFDSDAKPGFDYDFDAVKRFISEKMPSIYTVSEGKRYAINGQPYPEERLELPLHLNIPGDQELQHRITMSHLEGLHSYNIRLTDNLKGVTTDLKAYPEYRFSSPAGKIEGRFTLVIADITTDIDDPQADKNIFRRWQSAGVINIVPESQLWEGARGTVTLTDMAGRRIASEANISFSRGTPVQIAAPTSPGIYIIEIRSETMSWSGTIAIRN